MAERRPSPGDPHPQQVPALYDGSIDWEARLRCEIPILTDVFGPPGKGGVLDAGCGTGHHAIELAQRGYRVVGADISEEMLDIARRHAEEKGADIRLVLSPYATLLQETGGGFDGLFCLANSLTCAGTADAVAEALQQFARCLRPGGRFYIEVLNFTPMLPTWQGGAGPVTQPATGGSQEAAAEPPAATAQPRGDDGHEGFLLDPSVTQIAKVTIVADEQQDNPSSLKQDYRLYPISRTEFQTWCAAAGLRIDEQWGSVLGDPYDVARSVDMISVGTRV